MNFQDQLMISIYNMKILLAWLICSCSLQAQIPISGKVMSASDSLPIPGTSIYYDGTSIGVSSDLDGNFSIKTESKISSVLIINALGYQTRFFPNPIESKELGIVFLEESQEFLEEVHLETDPWSREKKLRIFRREFLGNTPLALQSKIENEEVLSLRYIPSTETLVAFADKPLKITNKYLGFKLTYTLTDFKAEFDSASGLQLTRLVYYEGYSFFEELRRKPTRRFLKNREKTYKGSSLHFMRALGSQQLAEQEFRIFHKGWEVLPYSYFEITPGVDNTKVELLEDKLTIVYGPLIQSSIQTEGKFSIDQNGNFTPPQNVLFSGEMSKSRIAEMLPLDYIY